MQLLATANADGLVVAVSSTESFTNGQTVGSTGGVVDVPGAEQVAGGTLLPAVRVGGDVFLQCGKASGLIRLLPWEHQWCHIFWLFLREHLWLQRHGLSLGVADQEGQGAKEQGELHVESLED